MDDFLRTINTDIFYHWIINQSNEEYSISVNKDNPSIIIIETDYSYSKIIFNNQDIIEFQVENLVTKEIELYLHFQLNTLDHAIKLFNEMLDAIKGLIEKPKYKVLISCSGGLTSSFFAQEVESAINQLRLDIEIKATGYQNIYEVGQDYDMILLAPQISYVAIQLKQILKNQVIISIPSQIFSKYDVSGLISLIFNNKNKTKHKEVTNTMVVKPHHHHSDLLCLAFFRNSQRVHISYQVYNEENEIVMKNEIIKPKVSIYDICDIIDTVLTRCPYLKTVGISIPGIINDGYVTSTAMFGLDDINILDVLTVKYSLKFILSNDVNSAVVGYHEIYKKATMALLFQPISYFSGIGIVVNDQLVVGSHNIAGESQYLPLNINAHQKELAATPEGALELVAKIIQSITAILSPELIVVYCDLITDKELLIEEIAKSIPRIYIPEIIFDDNIQETILLGQSILSDQDVIER